MKKSQKRKALLTNTEAELKDSTARLQRMREYRELPYKSRQLIGMGSFVYQNESTESKILDKMGSDNTSLDIIILWEKLSIRRIKERIKEIKNRDSARFYNPRRRSSTYEGDV